MEEKEFVQENKSLEKKVAGVIINSRESFEFVQNAIILAKQIKEKRQNYFEKMKTPAYASWKAICRQEAEAIKPIDDFIKRETKKSSDYLTEQDRIRREQQRKADEERRKKEQAEREKAEAAAARAREKAEELRKQAENDEAAAKKVEKLEAKAAALDEKAESIFVAPTIVQAAVDKTTRTDTGTISQKKDIEIVVKDVKALLGAIIRGEAPIAIIDINLSKLKAHIKLNQLTKLDGCEIREIITTQTRIAKGM